jgi:outer membrane murein-binding lipoprotein Lpp
VLFHLLAKQVDSAAAQELDKHLTTLASTMSTLNPDRAAVASEASAAVPIAQRMAERLAAMPYDRELALHMLQQITGDAENISLADERAAEQATMAIDSLYIAYSKEANPKNAEEVRSAINGLFQQMENPSSYNADQFAAALRRIHGML